MVLLDTNIFIIDRLFPRDDRYKDNKSLKDGLGRCCSSSGSRRTWNREYYYLEYKTFHRPDSNTCSYSKRVSSNEKLDEVLALNTQAPTLDLQRVIEDVETLPVDDQMLLIEIIRQRLIQQRRSELAAEVAEAREAYQTGNVRRGTVEDLLQELDA